MLLGISCCRRSWRILPQFIIVQDRLGRHAEGAASLPAAANAFGIFWMRQYIQSGVPDELLDAARIDGAGFFRQYWHLALPMIRPGLAFLGIYTFVDAWNDYIWPLVVLTNPDQLTLQVALAQLNVGPQHRLQHGDGRRAAWPSSRCSLVFSFFARGFIAGATEGAVQGS